MKVLVPLDGSRLSDAVVSHVRRLLHGQRGSCEAHLLHVIDPEHPRAEAGAEMRLHLGALARVLEADGLRTVLRVVAGEPVAKIIEAAVDDHIDLVAMATHGRSGLGRWARGSVAERVLRSCPVAVLLVNPKGLHLADDELRYREIVVALDEQGLAAGALERAAAMLTGDDARLTLLMPEAVDRARVRRDVERFGLTVARVLPTHGAPAGAILAHAREHGTDLLMLSDAPRSQLSAWPLDPAVEAVARRSPCPVLFLRATTTELVTKPGETAAVSREP